MLSSVFFTVALATLTAVSRVSALPTEDVSACRQIDLSKFFSKAGAKITQVAQYYNTTTYSNVTVGNETHVEPVVTPTYFTISGSVTIIDACSFQLDNFTISSVAPDTYWYGKMSSNYSVGDIVSWGAIVPLNDTTVGYSLIDGKTFESIDTLIMYSKSAGLQLAYVTFPRRTDSGNNGVAGGNTNGTTGSSSSSSASARGSPTISTYIILVISIVVALVSL